MMARLGSWDMPLDQLRLLRQVPVGGKIQFKGEVLAYTVQATDGRYWVCTKPFAARRTYLYCIVDSSIGMRGPDDMVFHAGYETRADCEERLKNLQNGETELSARHSCACEIVRAKTLPNAKPRDWVTPT